MRIASEDLVTKTLLACGVAGGFGFVAVAAIAGAVRPDYDSVSLPVSMLSLGDGGWVQISNFVITGLLMIAFAIGLRRVLVSGRASVWGPILIAVNGLGLIGAGVFNVDPGRGYPPGASIEAMTTMNGYLHTAWSLVAFLSMALACLVFASRFALRSGGRAWATYSVLTAFIVLGFLAAATVTWSGDGEFGGLLQRVSIYWGRVWISLLAARTLLGLGAKPQV